MRRSAFVLLVIPVAALAIVACTTLTQTVKDTKECATAELSKAAIGVLPVVAGILLTGNADWEQQLSILAQKYGADVIVCAVVAAKGRFQLALPQPSDGGVADAGLGDIAMRFKLKSSPEMAGVNRADSYLAGVHVTH